MNKSDSARLAAFLGRLGYQPTDSERQAELLVINACSVRQSAIDRVHGKARKWREWQRQNPKIKTILTGCVLPADRVVFQEKFDMVVGIGEWENIIKTLKHKNIKTLAGGGLILKQDYLRVVPVQENGWSALVPIMIGCNNFCAYCAVPFVRGRERSRSAKEVISEVKKLAAQGYLEITLLGQNVNSYRPTDPKTFNQKNPYHHPFAALLWEINQIKGLERIFFTAAHPKDMGEEVIDALALPKMVNYLHLPVQAGSSAVLKKMNRHYTAADYLKLVKKIKRKCPQIALGTDIIVGFPGETKADFLATLKLYRAADFDISYNARYSPRSGTAAASLPDNVSREEKDRRWWVLQRLMERTVLKKNQKYQGQTVSVLVDGWQDGFCQGNSREMKRVEFVGGKKLVGKIVSVKISKGLMWILKGELIIKN